MILTVKKEGNDMTWFVSLVQGPVHYYALICHLLQQTTKPVHSKKEERLSKIKYIRFSRASPS